MQIKNVQSFVQLLFTIVPYVVVRHQILVITYDLYCNARVTNTARRPLPYIFSGGSRISCSGRGPPTWALFVENVCENKRIGSHRGCAPRTPPRSANDIELNFCFPEKFGCITGVQRRLNIPNDLRNRECYHTHHLLKMTINGGYPLLPMPPHACLCTKVTQSHEQQVVDVLIPRNISRCQHRTSNS